MRKSQIFVVVLLAALPSLASAEHTRVTNPNALNVEFLGRGVFYSFSYDRVMNDDLSAGFGFGSVKLKSGGSAGMIPVYVNYYFTQDQGSVFATGGVSIITSEVANQTSSFGAVELYDGILPNVGLGYENRGDSGFLFRMAAYALIGDKISPWAGFTFGYAF